MLQQYMLYIYSLSHLSQSQVHYREHYFAAKTSTEKWALRKRCEEFQMRERAKELRNFMTITAFIASHSTANHHFHQHFFFSLSDDLNLTLRNLSPAKFPTTAVVVVVVASVDRTFPTSIINIFQLPSSSTFSHSTVHILY